MFMRQFVQKLKQVLKYFQLVYDLQPMFSTTY